MKLFEKIKNVTALVSILAIFTPNIAIAKEYKSDRATIKQGINSLNTTDLENSLINKDIFTLVKRNTSFRVLDVNHPKNPQGQYFTFQNSEIDRLLGRSNWDKEKLYIHNKRTGKIGVAVLWRRPYAGNTNLDYRYGHGRWSSGAKPNQWRVGDTVAFLNSRQSIDVLDVTHPKNPDGQYFTFSNSEIDRLLGKSNWTTVKLHIRNKRTGKVGRAVLWRKPYAGNTNLNYRYGHGRWDSGAKPGQWRVGDSFNIYM